VVKHISDVVKKIPEAIDLIIIVDDCCPEFTSKYVEDNIYDKRLIVTRNKKNLGVGGAMCVGLKIGLLNNCDVFIKIDGDDQMDISLIYDFITPIISNKFDYVKGNRLHSLMSIKNMPILRLIGNFLLSYINKIVTGNFNLNDPTNGYFAIRRACLEKINLRKISKDYFFESDLLFHINLINSKILEIKILSIYNNEKSNLNVVLIIPLFIYKNFKNLLFRFFH